MKFVFSKIGRSDSSTYAERLVAYIHAKQAVPYQDAYRYIHSYFPSMRDYEDILRGCLSAGYIKLEQRDGAQFLVAGKPLEATTAAHEAVLKA